ncbi:BrxA/BrxB family bacilliredoxin [Bacteroidia bacterium]|nr:BrxA/BrxB family bacilliredoxin [Bacteroidia bacterium]MDC1395363.1 BrxA/BrxB family bacilliredoxin [Bacteroidia bacterium]
MYPEELVAPMRADLTNNGFTELKDKEQVDSKLPNAKGTSLLVVNSVCGCAAGSARPGAVGSLVGEKKPDNLFTVFAGQDSEAVFAAREHLLPYPPSSPSIGVFKDGQLVHFVERHHIEGRSAEMIASHLQEVYKEYC